MMIVLNRLNKSKSNYVAESVEEVAKILNASRLEDNDNEQT